MTKFHNHYESLNVTRDAPAEVIRAAYRSLSQKHHPDKNRGDHDAAQMMIRLNTAYSVLSDPDQRELYDLQMLDQQLGHGSHFGMPDGWVQHLRNYAKGRDLRIAAMLLGSLSIALAIVMNMVWKENQSALRLERAAVYAVTADRGSLAEAGAPPGLQAPVGASNTKVTEERPKPAAAPKATVVPAAATKATEYERLTAMLKSMGFGLHKLDVPAPPPAKAADATRESAAPVPPPPVQAAKAAAPPETVRVREEIASPAAADPARSDAKPLAVASLASAPAAASANTASASHPLRTAVFADARACTPPPYPINAYRNGESGSVLLALLVASDGRVLESKVQKSSGSAELDKAARKALALCKFKPASSDAQAEPVWTNLNYVWTID
ncbi:TonB family protein [Duganella hordei]|uniref:TonB family protein n=1 Tax=Duganella hordei TaxID=2865934 RepID=UPI0030EAB8EC